jgi:ribosomal protein S27AE
MKKRKSQIKVIRHAPKVQKPKPDCPQCGKGFMSEWEEFELEYETYTRYRGCGRCGYWFDEYGNSNLPNKACTRRGAGVALESLNPVAPRG